MVGRPIVGYFLVVAAGRRLAGHLVIGHPVVVGHPGNLVNDHRLYSNTCLSWQSTM